MVASSMRLLTPTETDRIFDNDPEYAKIKQQEGVAPFCIQIKYQATTSASKTELGTAAANEFDGAAVEVSTVLCATAALTPGGSYFTFGVSDNVGAETKYAAWFLKYQVQTVVCLTAALTTSGTYFTIYDSEAAPTGYYVWLDKNGDGTTDKPTVATLTEVACDISGATTANDVGVIVAAALDLLAGFGAANTTGTVTITHATEGSPSADAVDVDTTYVIAKTQNGGVDPSVSGYTSAECDIKAATTAANVATIVAGVINALSDVGGGASTATVTITNAETFEVESTVDGAIATGFTITQLSQSSDIYGGSKLYFLSSSGDDTDAAAKDVRKLQLMGFYKDADGIPKLKTAEESMVGTTKTGSTEAKWFRLLHHKAIDWGSGDDNAAGNITVENYGGTDYQLIAATANESEGGVIWVPNHWHAKIAKLILGLNDIAIAAAIDGGIVVVEHSGFDETRNNRANTDPDNINLAMIAVNSANPYKEMKWPTKAELHGTDVAKLTFKESKVNTAVDIDFTAYVILWYKEN